MKKKMKPPAFQFYADDFLAGTYDLTLTEVGVYITLLCYQWSKGYIPNDPARISVITRSNNEPTIEAAVRHVIEQKFFECPDGNFRNLRLESVRDINQSWREKSVTGGKASGAKRVGDSTWGKEMVARRLSNQTRSEPINEPINEASSNSPSPSPSPSPLIPPTPLQGEKPASKEPKPKGPLQLRAEAIMRRRTETPLTSGEARAFSKNRAAIEATSEDDWKALERFYKEPQEKTFARKDLGALINNWNGEIDRAKRYFASGNSSFSKTPKLNFG